ncbi:MAG: methyltransferase [Myxococcota bacterium]
MKLRQPLILSGLLLSACATTSADRTYLPQDSRAPASAKAPPTDNVPTAEMPEYTPPTPMQAALSHPGRSQAERARDVYRNPNETLAFFGVDPDDAVLELWSGRGWYTHILAPYLAESGELHTTAYPLSSEKAYRREMTKDMVIYLNEYGYDDVGLVIVDTEDLQLGMDARVDVVLTFRNIHNWVKGGYDAQVYAQSYAALKPGGVFGVVEHRGPDEMTREQSSETGYMSQAQVIADIEAAGFRFIEASEINANPKDTKDHPEGVWTLPPSLDLGDVDRDRYLAIGESDRMTLKFIKPEDADAPE